MTRKNKAKLKQNSQQPPGNKQQQQGGVLSNGKQAGAASSSNGKGNKNGKVNLERLLYREEIEFPPITTDDVIKQLGMIGYHRARVMQLSNYDKIVGGVGALLNVFHPVAREIDWIFIEDDPKYIKKTMQDKKREVDQLLYALSLVSCPFPVGPSDFLNVNTFVMAQIVSWLLPKVSRAALEKEHYACFLACFNNTYEDPESAAMDFIRSLRRPNETQAWDFRRMDLFDGAILRDKKASGKVILAEYNFYARNSAKKYPPYCPGPEEGESFAPGGYNHIPEARYAEARQQLEEMGTKMFDKLQNTSKIVATQLYTLVEEFELAEGLQKIEARFVAEGAKYYKQFMEFSALEEHFRKVAPIMGRIRKPDMENLKGLVENLIGQGFLYEDDFYEEMEESKKIESRLRANRDEKGRLQRYCPFKREKADKEVVKRQEMEENIKLCDDLKTTLGATYNEYTRFCEERDSTEPRCSEENEFRTTRIMADVDKEISDAITIMMTKINHGIAEVELMLEPVEKADMELRKAFLAYATDASQLLSDYYWKAKFLKEERREMADMMDRFQTDVKKSLHQIHYGKLEMEKLMTLNIAIRNLQEKFDQWTKEADEQPEPVVYIDNRPTITVEQPAPGPSNERVSFTSSSSPAASSSIVFTFESEDYSSSESSSNGSAKENYPRVVITKTTTTTRKVYRRK